MTSTTRSVQTWMATENEAELESLVSEVTEGKTTLVNIVKALGEYLTSEEDKIRTKGVELLSSVIARCPADKLTRQAVRVLLAFLCQKLEDTETIIPALKGLLSLARTSNCLPEDAPAIAKALFTHAKMNVLVQTVRHTVFSILDALVDRHRQTLKELNNEFLSGYLRMAEGEKDPRNLLVAFAIDRVLIIEFDIKDYIEAFFNVTFCYFPITFRPPPNDPYGITTDDLKAALRGCLTATPEFGRMAIPLFLEKLTAGSPATKRDTLSTMSACFPVYGSGLARSSARELWNHLKLEIFQPTDNITADMALSCTQELVKTIYAPGQEDQKEDDEIEGLAQDVCQECTKILREPEKSQARPAIKVLCAFMSTTPSVARYTISKVVPYLMQLFRAIEETGARVSTLLLLSDVIAAARDATDKDSTPALLPFKDEVFGVATTGLTSASMRAPGIACMLGLVSTQGLLTDEELGFVVHKATEVLSEAAQSDEDEADILKLLTTITGLTPHHVVEQTLPTLFSALPENPPASTDLVAHAKYRRTLEALKTLCQKAELFEVFMVRLTTRVELLCVPASADPDADPEARAAYAYAILKTISRTLAVKVEEKHVDVSKYIERHVPRVFNLFVYASVTLPGGLHSRLISAAAETVDLVCQTLSTERFQSFLEGTFRVFVDGDVSGDIAQGQFKIPAGWKGPFADGASDAQKSLIVLFAGSVVSAYKENTIPVTSLSAFLDQLLQWSLQDTTSHVQQIAAWKIVSSLVNKHTPEVLEFLNDKVAVFWPTRFEDVGLDADNHRRTIGCWVYLARALLVQNHSLTAPFVDRLFEVFPRADIGWDAAKALGRLVDPHAEDGAVLVKKHRAVTRILHVQKFVSTVLPRIIDGATAKEGGEAVQLSYLVGLTALIRAIPKALYASYMPTLIPLLLRGVDLPDDEIRANVIDTFLAAADGDTPEKSLISAHATSLVTKMLKYSRVVEMRNVRVRVAALKYLGVIPAIVRYDVVHPVKARVVKELVEALDDPKRAVRREAVEARTTWFKAAA
ncbi:ARM repeat-containing protein [Cylindrobasidium torrendii FP15055 ss-10]|uniref:MMS19 nucleotide excision repair protein n=1 Tax=Cylindrobasidium torrendii FP15055 ss-10 TaxID=1314674 RepID=A0A0D7B3N6_9AGAR|nr:ARM repeat-containing protein [Cylindrobasidium torrendii FP15055 ss-10]